jgi:hypothetical protein
VKSRPVFLTSPLQKIVALYTLALIAGFLDIPSNRSKIQEANCVYLRPTDGTAVIAVTETGAIDTFEVEGNPNDFDITQHHLIPNEVSFY